MKTTIYATLAVAALGAHALPRSFKRAQPIDGKVTSLASHPNTIIIITPFSASLRLPPFHHLLIEISAALSQT